VSNSERAPRPDARAAAAVHAPSAPRPRTRSMAAVVVLALAATGGLAAWRSSAARREPPPVVSIDRNGLRYAYHTRSGVAFLWDLSVPEAERVNLVPTRPEDALRLRHELEKELDVEDLDLLHEPYRENAERLHGLGYL
jgi:hypothetical protein